MTPKLRQAIEAEYMRARQAEAGGRAAEAFHHLERPHPLAAAHPRPRAQPLADVDVGVAATPAARDARADHADSGGGTVQSHLDSGRQHRGGERQRSEADADPGRPSRPHVRLIWYRGEVTHFRHRARAFQASLIWALAALLLVASMLGAIATGHPPVHGEDLAAAVAEADRTDCDEETPHPPGLASLSHDLAHAWHHCGVIMAVLSTPLMKLLALPPTHPPSVEVRAASAPALQGLFRPPIR